MKHAKSVDFIFEASLFCRSLLFKVGEIDEITRLHSVFMRFRVGPWAIKNADVMQKMMREFKFKIKDAENGIVKS